jgi:hypothetical protein
MTSPALAVVVAAFLAGAATAAFIMMVVGIRKVDRSRDLPPARTTPLSAATSSVLRAGTWPNRPGLGDPEIDASKDADQAHHSRRI